MEAPGDADPATQQHPKKRKIVSHAPFEGSQISEGGTVYRTFATEDSPAAPGLHGVPWNVGMPGKKTVNKVLAIVRDSIWLRCNDGMAKAKARCDRWVANHVGEASKQPARKLPRLGTFVPFDDAAGDGAGGSGSSSGSSSGSGSVGGSSAMVSCGRELWGSSTEGSVGGSSSRDGGQWMAMGAIGGGGSSSSSSSSSSPLPSDAGGGGALDAATGRSTIAFRVGLAARAPDQPTAMVIAPAPVIPPSPSFVEEERVVGTVWSAAFSCAQVRLASNHNSDAPPLLSSPANSSSLARSFVQLERLSTWSVERLSQFVRSHERLEACARNFERMQLSGGELVLYLQMAPRRQAFADLECDAGFKKLDLGKWWDWEILAWARLFSGEIRGARSCVLAS